MRLLRLAERALSDAESAAHAPTMGYRQLTRRKMFAYKKGQRRRA
jgi:hypothetical protein